MTNSENSTLTLSWYKLKSASISWQLGHARITAASLHHLLGPYNVAQHNTACTARCFCTTTAVHTWTSMQSHCFQITMKHLQGAESTYRVAVVAATSIANSLPEEDAVSPALIGSETYEWSVIPDLDKFFRNLYMCVCCLRIVVCCCALLHTCHYDDITAEPPRTGTIGTRAC